MPTKVEIKEGQMRYGMESVLTQILLKFFQLGFCVVVLSIVGAVSWVPDPAVRPANSTSTGPLCNGFYQTILWEDQLGAIKLTNETTVDGDVATCRLVVASMSIAVIVSIVYLFIVLLVSLGYVYDFMANNTKLHVLSSFLHVSVTVLVTVSAAVMAVGYDRTCESNKCMSPEAVGLKHFPQRDQVLAAVIFCWFAILPWATDTGFIIKRYINTAFPKKVGA